MLMLTNRKGLVALQKVVFDDQFENPFLSKTQNIQKHNLVDLLIIAKNQICSFLFKILLYAFIPTKCSYQVTRA